MKDNGLDAYIIPASDPHQDEYIPNCWQFRKWLSGFTGSAGTLVITDRTAGLWTDSRYFLQAESQLRGSGFSLFRLVVPHTPEHVDWLLKNLAPGSTAGIDGHYFSHGMVKYLEETLSKAGHSLRTDLDLITPVWTDRPPLPQNPVFAHDVAFAGESRKEKIARVAADMEGWNAGYHLISTLDDIAWLLNLRGSDIAFCPFFISHYVMEGSHGHLFIDPVKVPGNIADALQEDGITLHPYGSVTDFLESLPAGSTICYAPDRVSHSLVMAIPAGVVHLPEMNITTRLKAVKNPTEIDNLRKVMVRDGVAWVKTLAWITRRISEGGRESEWSVAGRIAEFRSEQPNYQGESFQPISSWGRHGAVVHYSVTPEESLELEPYGIYLLDSGGHYSGGTTDTTRTIALSPPGDRERSDFTRALKGTLGVSMLRFPAGTKGYQMDILARKALWDAGLNYGHGTGHGVGFFLSVHEGPQTIGTSASGNLNTPLLPGMVTTVEPAIYREGEYGMRTENMTLVVEDTENEYGRFLRFETLTLVPIDRNLIDKNLLTYEEVRWIDDYHRKVKETLSQYLSPKEREWLEEGTKPL
jgi:Xaa-Pro aminopeptidase